MTIEEKIIILNKAHNNISEALKSISYVFKDNVDIGVFIWRASKGIDFMQQAICKTLDQNIIQEEFDKIIKVIDLPNE